MPFVVPTVGRIAAGLRYPYQLDSEEGFVLWQAWQLRHGHNIFRRLDSPPYVAATYAPLYPLISAALQWGKSPSFFGGRLLAALSLAAICLFMALIIWSETRQALAALLGPLLFLNSYDVYQWLPFHRVDFMALALGMAGLWFVRNHRLEACATGRSSKWRFRAVCACFVAMVYTKQVELAPFVAALLYLLFSNRALAWRLLRNVAAWGLAIAAVLTLLTRGQFLVHNIYYNANPFSLWQLKTMLIGRYLDDGRFMVGHFSNFHRFFMVALIVCLVWFVLERLRPRLEKAKGEEQREKGKRQEVASEHITDTAPQSKIENPESRIGSQQSAREKQSGVEPPHSKVENPKSQIQNLNSETGWGHLGLFALYAVVASFGLLGVGKIGAATNYLIEPKAAWSLFIALVLGKTIRPSPASGRVFSRRPVFFPVAVVLALHAFEFLCSSTLFQAVLPYLRQPESRGLVARLVQKPTVRNYLASRPPVLLGRDNRNPTVADVINGHRIVEALRQAEGPVFCEHAILAMHAGHDVYIQPFIMSQLAREGKWDQAPVVEALRKGQFALIVTTEDITKEGFFFHYTDEMVEAMRTAYRLRETLGSGPEGPAVFTHYLFEPLAETP
ncbi:hypothetical protein AMJ85_08450 [candidate division BRC1 bacterium SM23_51]|nr:MAG: hypothetical protein AMJ85_08450 [candidate division BRC1 bacterium SM23_51]